MILLGSFGVAAEAAAEAVVADDSGLQGQQVVQGLGLGGSDAAGGVPPENFGMDGSEQFLHLRNGDLLQVFVKRAVLRGVPMPAAPSLGVAAGMVPVLDLGVVNAEVDALFAGGVGEFLDDIALERSGVHDVEGVGGLEHREAVVVLGGDDDVFHAGILGDFDEVIGIELGGVELVGVLVVLGDGNPGVVHDPFADAGDIACRGKRRRGRNRRPSG